MTATEHILILGASTRAAAFSALRAGLMPRCGDFFADRDLAATCPVARVGPDEDGQGFERVAHAAPCNAWLYTGPLENHPGLVERLSRTMPLHGTGPLALRAVRDPLQIADVLRRQGLDSPDVRLSPQGLPRDGTWMVKPLASGGGRLVRLLDDRPLSFSEPCYYQRRVEGPSLSALFIADHGTAELIGVTRQRVGAPGSPFAYRGSIGPWIPSYELSSRLRAVGHTLASSFVLAGWFGVDFILRDDRPWPVEVNPRYVASIEVLELAMGRSLMAEHLRACGVSLPLRATPTWSTTSSSAQPVVGKAILYARKSMVVPDIPVDDIVRRDTFAIPAIADVPWPGTLIETGEPVMTMLTSGPDVATCEARLQSLEELWWRRLEG
jgi:uncharacterized protein